jgi:hypothetical protein
VKAGGSAYHPLSRWYLSRLINRPWRWRRYILPKCRLAFNGLHCVISQKIELFITTDVRTSNPTQYYLPLRPITVTARLKHELSSPNRTLGSWVRIPLKAWMPVWFYSLFVLCV